MWPREKIFGGGAGVDKCLEALFWIVNRTS